MKLVSNINAKPPSKKCGLRTASEAALCVLLSGPWAVMGLCKLEPPGTKPFDFFPSLPSEPPLASYTP